MDGDFFVMLTTQNGGYTPLMNKELDDIAKFESEYLAREAGNNNILGHNFGYEVFMIGDGV